MTAIVEIIVWTKKSLMNPLQYEPRHYTAPWPKGVYMDQAIEAVFPDLLIEKGPPDED